MNNRDYRLRKARSTKAEVDWSTYKILQNHVNRLIDKNNTNDLILNLTPENVTQHSRIVITTHKGSSTPTKMSKIIGRQIH